VLALDLLVSKAIEDENERLDLSILGSLPAEKKKETEKRARERLKRGRSKGKSASTGRLANIPIKCNEGGVGFFCR
jgi:hypothetical protein